MAYSGTQVTRLGLHGGARELYGSFAGKAEAVSTRADLTRLGLAAIPRQRYGSFAGKAAAAPTGGGFLGLQLLGVGV